MTKNTVNSSGLEQLMPTNTVNARDFPQLHKWKNAWMGNRVLHTLFRPEVELQWCFEQRVPKADCFLNIRTAKSEPNKHGMPNMQKRKLPQNNWAMRPGKAQRFNRFIEPVNTVEPKEAASRSVELIVGDHYAYPVLGLKVDQNRVWPDKPCLAKLNGETPLVDVGERQVPLFMEFPCGTIVELGGRVGGGAYRVTFSARVVWFPPELESANHFNNYRGGYKSRSRWRMNYEKEFTTPALVVKFARFVSDGKNQNAPEFDTYQYAVSKGMHRKFPTFYAMTTDYTALLIEQVEVLEEMSIDRKIKSMLQDTFVDGLPRALRHDMHSSNIGVRDGRELVILDMGFHGDRSDYLTGINLMKERAA